MGGQYHASAALPPCKTQSGWHWKFHPPRNSIVEQSSAYRVAIPTAFLTILSLSSAFNIILSTICKHAFDDTADPKATHIGGLSPDFTYWWCTAQPEVLQILCEQRLFVLQSFRGNRNRVKLFRALLSTTPRVPVWSGGTAPFRLWMDAAVWPEKTASTSIGQTNCCRTSTADWLQYVTHSLPYCVTYCSFCCDLQGAYRPVHILFY